MTTSHNLRPIDHDASHGAVANAFSLHTVLVALRCWWKLAVPLSLMCAAAAGAGAYYWLKPHYTATAWLIIRDKPHFSLQNVPQDSPEKFVQNQIELIKSEYVLEPVASNPAIASTPELAEEPDRVQALRKQLKIKAVGRSDFFTVEFTSLDRNKAALLVNEVAKAYLKLQERTSSARTAAIISSLQAEQAAQETVVETLRNNLEDLTKQLTGKDLYSVQAKSNVIELRNAMADLQGKLLDAEIEQSELKAQLEYEKLALDRGSYEPLEGEVNAHIDGLETIKSLRTSIEVMKLRKSDFERAMVAPAKNSAYQLLVQQLKSSEERHESMLETLKKQVADELTASNRDKQKAIVADVARRIARTDFTIKVLNDRLSDEMKGQTQYKGETLKLEFARADYDRAKKLYESITDRIVAMQSMQQWPAQVEVFKEAVPPAGPSDASPLKKVIVLALCGLMLPFGLAVGFEQFRPRVSTTKQLQSAGDIAFIGEVTTLPKRYSSRRRASKPSRDLQLFEESINGLRTHLTLPHEVEERRVFVVTSAVSGEGKTSLASQLAVSLATVTGEPTLLIDGDLRSPDIHRIFDVERGLGLADVLGGLEVHEAIETGFSENLHLLTSGDLRMSPHRLLGRSDFGAVIERLKQSYRHIVIDTPPILCASEALVLARTADTAVVCVRRDYSRYDQTMEAIGRLRSSGVESINAVLTGVPTQTYAYKYGSYYFTEQVRHSEDAASAV